jgi:hypothetical protein
MRSSPGRFRRARAPLSIPKCPPCPMTSLYGRVTGQPTTLQGAGLGRYEEDGEKQQRYYRISNCWAISASDVN